MGTQTRPIFGSISNTNTREKDPIFEAEKGPHFGDPNVFFFVPRALVVITLLQECLPAPAAVSIHSSMCSPPLASLPRVWHHATFSARSLWDAYGGQRLSRSPASFPCTSGGARAFVAALAGPAGPRSNKERLWLQLAWPPPGSGSPGCLPPPRAAGAV